ncbi:L-aspartate oxidase [Vallitalea guaymasensis]|uniref:L-aspartate oxidase n=1 Tax=Vallitalea guaymasensis TaxID=1185412 RepID=A0A8J8MF24_9FIRM|nr:L-aspartate oxidase [Vallitalea guaymasensis]QUH31746.1 L-aspartate oxidase [Vallitalea guaymasensis]
MREYIIPFDTNNTPKEYTDVVIVGCGIAGLYTALMLPSDIDVTIVAKEPYKETNSYLAQGGIAAPCDKFNDTKEMFFNDTMVCGRGESDTEAVNILVNEAMDNIIQLEKLGVKFDKDDNGFLLGKEGAHSVSRIVRSGDSTGKSVMEALYHLAKSRENINIRENIFVIDILTYANKSTGILILDDGRVKSIFSKYTIINTGGIGNLFEQTTNAKGINGDGIAMILRANGIVRNMSYLQFHPTVFYNNSSLKQSFLISEAVRGEGALLYNERGERFMEKVHPMKELAPRDIVSLAIMQQIKKQITPCVYLDITHWNEEALKLRFPTIFGFCQRNNINMAENLVPVAPRMHYFMGGIKVDINGKTSIKNLYACGECSCTGVHGKNRLASNSLLEAIVFGRRIARNIKENIYDIIDNDKDIRIVNVDSSYKIMEDEHTIAKWMGQYFGIDRTIAKVKQLENKINKAYCNAKKTNIICREEIEKVNMISVIKAIINDDLNKKITKKTNLN